MKQRRGSEESVQMFHENTGAFTFHSARECICVFRTNRTREVKGSLLWPPKDKGRGAWCGPAPGVLRDFLGGTLKKKRLGWWRIEIGVEREERP
ncbi:hypothetical protein TNCV_4682131 [Trichonephila clavipes]|nr:hypothetical protein TNCV_4682131 [Trichonephila clavipes]